MMGPTTASLRATQRMGGASHRVCGLWVEGLGLVCVGFRVQGLQIVEKEMHKKVERGSKQP